MVSAVQDRRVFLGEGVEEIIPKNVEDIAVKGLEDKDYVALVKFMEGPQDWSLLVGTSWPIRN